MSTLLNAPLNAGAEPSGLLWLVHLAEQAMPHLLLAPIVLPLFTAALMLLLPEERTRIKLAMNLLSTLLGLVLSALLLLWVTGLAGPPGGPATLGVYLPGNWPAPFGIVLVLDHLAALMLLLTSVVALASIVFAASRWHRAGVLYHALFQFQLMGLAGAFLTADVFNLFVFFEIMLAASYGLLLHGSGRARVQAGLHYIAINLAASSLFLVGVSMLYGITGTLNMADLARAIPLVAPGDRGLLHSALGILATAFLIKAAVWPLNFWLVPAYNAATAPVGALFAIMTKVGIYALLRLWTLLLGVDAGASAYFGAHWLLGAGMCTMAVAALGMLGSQRITHLAGWAAVLSSATLLTAMGWGQERMTAALLYYLPSSTLAVAALFLLADLIERWRNDGTRTDADDEDAPFLNPELLPTPGVNLDDDEEVLIGRVIPAATAFLGLAFLGCTLVIAGLPPLSGFLGKFAMLTALLNPLGLGASTVVSITPLAWGWLALLIVSGLLALLALTRTGMRHFWSAQDRPDPTLRLIEGLPIAALLAACALMTIYAGDVVQFTEATAQGLHHPAGYIEAVMRAAPVAPTVPEAAP